MDSHIPAKKAKIESSEMPETSRSYCIDNAIQDETGKDLWADYEFTAEEFDLLHSQVCSQALNMEVSHNLDPISNEVQKLKEQNYCLEGKIKMLHIALEKNSQELDKERLEKMNLVEKYSEQQKQQQKYFEKEKERMETLLQFKEQELQAAFGKITALEQKDKLSFCANKTCNVNNTPRTADISKDFICGASSGTKVVTQKANVTVQTENKDRNLSHKLKLWCKKGSLTDLVTSNVLCRARNLFYCIDSIIHEEKVHQRNECVGSALFPFHYTDVKNNTNFNIALSRLNIESNKLTRDRILLDKLPSFQILRLLQQALKECLNIMSGIVTGGQQQTSSLSWSSILFKDKDWSRLNVLLNFQKHPLSPVVMEEIFSLLEKQQVMTLQYLYHLLSLEAIRYILFFATEKDPSSKRMEKFNENSEVYGKSIHPVIDEVLTASTPLFYEDKCVNKCAVEWSLAVLIKSAEYCKHRFDRYLPDISVCGITSGKCSLTSSWLLLHLLQYLLPLEFLTNHIGRHSPLCIYHSLYELCVKIGNKNLGNFEMKIMTLVLNLISGLLSKQKLVADSSVNCVCLHKLFDIIMKILNAEIRLYTCVQSDKHFLFLQNVMSSLNWLRQLSIFQDQFANNQTVYINLWNDSSLQMKTLSST